FFFFKEKEGMRLVEGSRGLGVVKKKNFRDGVVFKKTTKKKRQIPGFGGKSPPKYFPIFLPHKKKKTP
ncbi:hypothetical protein, partial [Salmonella enterica]|uniref:hypothetical protein n=1 Tax=Salmonella enterica TaxID=28901 RepID=UPI0019553B98